MTIFFVIIALVAFGWSVHDGQAWLEHHVADSHFND
jgi:hypothetical protein